MIIKRKKEKIIIDGKGAIIFTPLELEEWGQSDKKNTLFKNFKILLMPGLGWSRKDIVKRFTKYLDEILKEHDNKAGN